MLPKKKKRAFNLALELGTKKKTIWLSFSSLLKTKIQRLTMERIFRKMEFLLCLSPCASILQRKQQNLL